MAKTTTLRRKDYITVGDLRVDHKDLTAGTDEEFSISPNDNVLRCTTTVGGVTFDMIEASRERNAWVLFRSRRDGRLHKISFPTKWRFNQTLKNIDNAHFHNNQRPLVPTDELDAIVRYFRDNGGTRMNALVALVKAVRGTGVSLYQCKLYVDERWETPTFNAADKRIVDDIICHALGIINPFAEETE